jgi:hypothetical protein
MRKIRTSGIVDFRAKKLKIQMISGSVKVAKKNRVVAATRLGQTLPKLSLGRTCRS